MLGKISKGKLLLKKLVIAQKRFSLIVSPKSADIRSKIRVGLYNYEDGSLVPYMSKVDVYSFFKMGEIEKVNLIIHSRTPGIIIGKGGRTINELKIYLSNLTGASVEIQFKQVDVLKDIYDFGLADGLYEANTFFKKIKWIFGKKAY